VCVSEQWYYRAGLRLFGNNPFTIGTGIERSFLIQKIVPDIGSVRKCTVEMVRYIGQLLPSSVRGREKIYHWPGVHVTNRTGNAIKTKFLRKENDYGNI
jgi:hypothetical protein